MTRRTLRYEHHRTTRTGRLVLAFADVETGEEAAAFFNVTIGRLRGPERGRLHRTGDGGQFFPPPRSKFRKFWMRAVGRAPRQWSRVHEELRPRLAPLLFTGLLRTARDRYGREYVLADDIQLADPLLISSLIPPERPLNTSADEHNAQDAFTSHFLARFGAIQ